MGLGSMGLGVGGTAVVLSQGTSLSGGSTTFMVLVIWLAIAVINVTFNNRR
jgi:hypothetical protein